MTTSRWTENAAPLRTSGEARLRRALRDERSHLRIVGPHAPYAPTPTASTFRGLITTKNIGVGFDIASAEHRPLSVLMGNLFLALRAATRPTEVFGAAWHEGLGRCLVGRTPKQLSAVTRTVQQLGALGTLREPHIEDFEGQVRFVWNRDDHYIEVSVYPDGLVGWYHGCPDGSFEGDDGEGLDDRFRRAMEHAR